MLMRSLALSLLATTAIGAFAASAPSAEVLVPLGTPVADRTQEMWSARWWMWAASFDGASPIQDTTGDLCGMRQMGEVFFLAGTYESRPVHRTCKVPAGKHLFFPLVNYVVTPNGGISRCEEITAQARAMTDEPARMFLELDGKPLPDMKRQRIATSECFNVAAFSGGPKMMSASNGYWAMLKPLPAGKHTLHLGGALPSLRQDVTYTLLVE